MDIIWLILGAAYLLSLVVQNRLQATHRKLGSIRNSANLSGAEIAHTILDANDMRQVDVRAVRGKLSDHYDPRNKSVQLSETVYGVPSVAAMAVAAHETGHAIQDKAGYWPLAIRTSLAPFVNAAARFGIPAAVIGLLFGAPLLIQIGAIAYVSALAFQFLTLPLEFDASRRAIIQLDRLQLLNDDEEKGVKSMLRAAAMTYVAGAASAAAYILYLVLMGGRWLLRKPPPVPPPRLP
jgi:Zn-dependent membrane protease YugP